MALSQGIDRSDLAALGAALDTGSFTFVALSSATERPTWLGYLDRSVARANAPSTVAGAQLDQAFRLDAADDADVGLDDPDDAPGPAAG